MIENLIPSIAVSHNRPQVVNVRRRFTFLWSQLPARVEVLAVVQLLGFEESLNLVWHGVVWVITKVCGDFIGSCQ